MIDENTLEQLQELNFELFGDRGEGGTILSNSMPPFDISKPNIHDSKKEFLRELKMVESIIENARGITDHFKSGADNTDGKQKAMVARLGVSISQQAFSRRRGKRIETASDLILSNLAADDFFFNSLMVVFDMIYYYEQRLKELKVQEAQFWSVPHRAPNYYARTIALRFAKHYAGKKRSKPTFGTAREGNHPSTEYGRGLERVFKILGIKADVRKSAEWAIAQLTEEDWNPPVNAALGLLTAMGKNHTPGETKNRISQLLMRPAEGS